MNLARNLIVGTLMTLVTTVLLGLGYPLLVTALAQVVFPDKANGQLLEHNGRVVGSRIIAQPFTSAGYFWPRPSQPQATAMTRVHRAGRISAPRTRSSSTACRGICLAGRGPILV